jgi:hypothetical protein
MINLRPYTGTVRLRLKLEVDQFGADKGWVFDNIQVQAALPAGPGGNIFLPVIMKEE